MRERTQVRHAQPRPPIPSRNTVLRWAKGLRAAAMLTFNLVIGSCFSLFLPKLRYRLDSVGNYLFHFAKQWANMSNPHVPHASTSASWCLPIVIRIEMECIRGKIHSLLLRMRLITEKIIGFTIRMRHPHPQAAHALPQSISQSNLTFIQFT